MQYIVSIGVNELQVPDVWLDLLMCVFRCTGVDAEAARREEEDCMMADANRWLQNNNIEDNVHPKTGATALHVAAAKGYINVMKWVGWQLG